MTIEHFNSYLRVSSKVLNGQDKYVIVASELMFPFISIITHHFRTPGEKNPVLNKFNLWKYQVKSKVCLKFFTTINLVLYRGIA